MVFLGWPYYISSPSSSNGDFVILFHNFKSSWNSSYLYKRLILSRSIYIKQCVHLHREVTSQHRRDVSHTTVVIIFLTVVILRPPLKLLCRPVTDRLSFFLNWIFEVNALWTAHHRSAGSYRRTSLDSASILLSAGLYCHNLLTSQPFPVGFLIPFPGAYLYAVSIYHRT